MCTACRVSGFRVSGLGFQGFRVLGFRFQGSCLIFGKEGRYMGIVLFQRVLAFSFSAPENSTPTQPSQASGWLYGKDWSGKPRAVPKPSTLNPKP